jgi:hypothetical protein
MACAGPERYTFLGLLNVPVCDFKVLTRPAFEGVLAGCGLSRIMHFTLMSQPHLGHGRRAIGFWVVAWGLGMRHSRA